MAKFHLKKGDHEVVTELASEATQLRAAGYSSVKKPSAAAAKNTQDKK